MPIPPAHSSEIETRKILCFKGKTTWQYREAYTDITEVTEELLHTLVDKIVVHEKEVIDGEIIMRVDIYYRFIGKVGDAEGEALKAPKIRRNTKLLMEAGIISEV